MVQQSDIQALSNRIARLERRNRVLQCAVVGCVVVGSCFVLLGAADAKKKAVEAQAFILTDAAGKTRGEFVMDGPNPAVRLLDDKGTVKIELMMKEQAAGVVCRDANNKVRIGMAFSDEHNIACLVINSEKEKPQLQLAGKAIPNIELFDEDDNARLKVSFDTEGDPFIALRDREDYPRILLSTAKEATYVRVAGGNKKSTAWLGVDEKNGPRVKITSDDNTDRVGIGYNPEIGSYVNLIDGKMLRSTFRLHKDGPRIRCVDERGKAVIDLP